jgi:rhomboid protease GluP
VFLHLPFRGGLFALMHIFFNMYILSVYGAQVEQVFGSARYLFLYLATGFFASATSYAFNDCANGLGASGAVFGIVGVLIVYIYNRRSANFADPYLRSLGTFVLLNLALGFLVPRIDNLAHIGGLVGGLALGAGFDRKRLTKASAPLPLQIAAGALVVGIGVALVVQKTASFDISSCFG